VRNSLAIGFALMSFALGAWLSPRAAAQSGDGYIPVRPERGQRVHISRPEGLACEVENPGSVATHWVRCTSGMWLNLTNGTGYTIERTTK
jgi:hypothetical protein